MAQEKSNNRSAGQAADGKNSRAKKPAPEKGETAALDKRETAAVEKGEAAAPEKREAAAEEKREAAAVEKSAPTPPHGQQQVQPEIRRRAAGPARRRIAANDDSPSIGGLIYALQQRPSNQPFLIAGGVTAVWLVLTTFLSWSMLSPEIASSNSIWELLARPAVLAVTGTVFVPIVLFWFLALLTWRTQELRLMSSAMTEVAVRLAEPDQMSEQAVASLGQSVRRQVVAMNDGISRALGRAGELETLVHNEVSALERSYNDNELRIRTLIDELASEREAIDNNSERVSDAIRGVGTEVTRQIEMASAAASQKLLGVGKALNRDLQINSDRTAAIISENGNTLLQSLKTVSQRISTDVPGVIQQLGQEQSRLTSLIQEAGKNLVALQSSLSDRTGRLEGSLGRQTKYLEKVLKDYTQSVDNTIMERAKMLDARMVMRTQEIDQAFTQRIKTIDHAITRSTTQIDQSFSAKARLLQQAMANHGKALNEALSRQSADLDGTLLHGVDAIQKTSERITSQSIKTIEGLATQAEFLEDVSSGLLHKINSLTDRFEHQSDSIRKTAYAVESSNRKVDTVLEARHSALNNLLENMSNKTDNLGRMAETYSSKMERSLGLAEERAKTITDQIAEGTARSSARVRAELDNLREAADVKAEETLLNLRNRFSQVTDEVNSQLATMTSKVADTTSDMHARTSLAARDLEVTRTQLRERLAEISTDVRDTTQHLHDHTDQAAQTIQRTHEEISQRVAQMSDQLGETTQNIQQRTQQAAVEIQRSQEALNKRTAMMLVQLGDTTRSVRERTESAAAEIKSMQAKVYEQIDKLPETTRESAQGMRAALQNQLKALDGLSAFAQQQAHARDISLPDRSVHKQARHPQPTTDRGTLSRQRPGAVQAERLQTISHSLSQQMAGRQNGPDRQMGDGAPDQDDADDVRWSLGDLLARASDDDHGDQDSGARERMRGASGNAQDSGPDGINFKHIAGAIDVVTAHQIWGRFRAGERGVLARHIYSDQGQITYDEIMQRYRAETSFKTSVDRYLVDFENLLREARKRDPRGKLVEKYLISETGRVYLLLAHASGRIA